MTHKICPCCFALQGFCEKETKMKMNMPSTDKLMNRFFRRVDNVVWDLMTGKVGVQTADGIASIEGEADDAQININFFEDMAVAIPAFAQNTPKTAVNVGDMIYTTGDTPGWVVSKNEKDGEVKNFKIMRANGVTTTWTPPKVQMFGLDSGVMVVRSLTTMLGGTSGLGAMQGMLLPMLAMGGDGGDLEEMMPMLLMSQTMGAGAGDPAASGNMMNGMMQMMMMKKMFGGSSDSTGYSKKNVFRS